MEVQTGLRLAKRLNVVEQVALLLLIREELPGAALDPLRSVECQVQQAENHRQDDFQRCVLARDHDDHPANGDEKHENLHQRDHKYR